MKKFLKGKGLKLHPEKIDNLFRLNPKYKQEILDFVYLTNFLKKSQYAPILLKEAFFILKPKGYLIIEYKPTKEINFQSMENLFWWLFKGNYNILKHTQAEKSQLIIQKKKAIFLPNDSINKWSFGIITNGQRDDWLESIITSIKKQKIPQYEIIVCGKYRKRPEKNFVYIDFNERSDQGWITKKKNLIAEKAQFENLCLIHDRLIFNSNWYKGMKKYGNAFEILGCIQEEKTGARAGDWVTFGGPIHKLYKIATLDYKEWDYYMYLSGQMVIIKKSMFEKVLLDETRYWVNLEDVDFSFRTRDAGFIIRFNPYSSFTTLAWRYGYTPSRYNPSKGFIPDMIVRRTMRLIARTFYKVPIVNQVMFRTVAIMERLGIYQKMIAR